uniref:Nondiscriminating glutamyl-tRNA synthetase EARS2, mitochondrial n=1 Tax=Piliocolobus tephrosceles TaxID=591936 RepID=A0A8C9LNY1_9PRIM
MKLIFFLVNLIIINTTCIVKPKQCLHYLNKKNDVYFSLDLLHNRRCKLHFLLKKNIKNNIYRYKHKNKSRINNINKKNNDNGDDVFSVSEPRLRFAPSPTGYIHVGGCRTFLYNYILSKQMNGKLIFRLEDTDTKRNTEGSLHEMIKDLKWLNLDWDEGIDIGGEYGPYKQSEKIEVYKKIAHDLVDQKRAYLCFCTQDELKEKKERAKLMKKKYIYDRMCRYLNEEIVTTYLIQNKSYTIRFKSPENRKIVLKDILKKEIKEVVNEDFIILRSNNAPTYNFSAAVDDHLMKITHVIRGSEHISNTFKQILILESLNANIPMYAHVPVITDIEKKKLAKGIMNI